MTEDEARGVYKFIAHAQGFTVAEKVAVWVAVLTSPNQSDVQCGDAERAAIDLVGEVEDPRRISPAMVLGRARSFAKAREPSTVSKLDARWQIEDARKRRYVCTQEDRAALASLQRAFANRGKAEAAEFDRLMERMKVRDGVEWVAPFEDEVPF